MFVRIYYKQVEARVDLQDMCLKGHGFIKVEATPSRLFYCLNMSANGLETGD